MSEAKKCIISIKLYWRNISQPFRYSWLSIFLNFFFFHYYFISRLSHNFFISNSLLLANNFVDYICDVDFLIFLISFVESKIFLSTIINRIKQLYKILIREKAKGKIRYITKGFFFSATYKNVHTKHANYMYTKWRSVTDFSTGSL